MQKLIHLVMDYASGDLACSEVVSALAAQISGEYHWHLTSVNSFDTVSTGFVTAQLSIPPMYLRPSETIVYSNCAPRKDLNIARKNNEGEGLLFATLNNGVNLFVVNSGYSLSFVRDEIKQLFSIKVSTGGSQFRSRDNFPAIIGKFTRGEFDFIGSRLEPTEVIPNIPTSVIGYVDSFGNLKTTIRDGDSILYQIEPGQRVDVTINGVTMTATASSGSFNVKEGDIAFSPGSSGGDKRYWEIFQRGGSAWHTYRKPRPGSEILIKL
ncbi:hypothetical protein UFOVP410_55 [uncultured Caudovirales phage]|uniref:Uncharacterized protein n=1 Tax=uncultured Caudovirales phage TaxID=2100421 RepID=A0A6J5M7Z2_9CAUD|nr:hypothetical protein UFOVP410_55 [uncultured Caudovirales phage]